MRFFKPSTTEYQSQFSPLNLDFMQKNLAQKEANDVVAEDLIDKTSQLQVRGGNYTKPEEVKMYNDWIQTNTANIREKFAAGDMDAKEASRNLNKIVQFYNTNEVVKRINNDYIYSKDQNKNLAEGKLNQAVGTNFNYLGEIPTWNKVNMSEITDDQHAALYNTLSPTSINAKENYEQNYKDLKSNMYAKEWAGAKGYDLEYTASGLPFIKSDKGSKMDRYLTYQMVYEKGLQMADAELRNASTPYVQYQFGKYGKDNYKRENFAQDFANNYVGTFNEHSESDMTNRDIIPGLIGKEGEQNTLNEPYSVPTSNIAPVDQEWGVDGNKFFDKRGIDAMNTWSPDEVGRFVENMNDTSTSEGRKIHGDPDIKTGPYGQGAVESWLNKNVKEIDLVQPYDLPELEGKIFNAWAATNPEYKEYAELNKSQKKDIPFEVLAEMTQGFLKANKEYIKDVVKTANTATQINYHTDAEINDAAKRNTAESNYLRRSKKVWEIYAGNRPTATVADVLSNAANSRIWSLSDKKFLEEEDRVAINTAHGKTNVPSLNQTNPENLLNMITGDETFKNAVTFSTPDGKQYMIEDRTFGVYTPGEEAANLVYRKGKMALGKPVELDWGDGTNNIKYKIDKDNKVFLLNKSGSPIIIKGKEIPPFENAANMLYQLSMKDSPYLKQSLYPKAAKSKPAARKK
jgi:hypothetical protein